MIYQRPIQQNNEFFKFADIFLVINIIFVYLNYQENKKNVKVSAEIAKHLKQIDEDGIVKRLCEKIEIEEN